MGDPVEELLGPQGAVRLPEVMGREWSPWGRASAQETWPRQEGKGGEGLVGGHLSKSLEVGMQ